MGSQFLPKRWGNVAPSIHARPLLNHPLCPKHGFIINNGAVVDIVRMGRAASYTTGTWSTTAAGSVARGSWPLIAREHTGTSDVTNLGLGDAILPLGPCTLVISLMKTDASLRNAVAIKLDKSGDGTYVFDAHIPFSDGIVYWQYGGITAGSTRLTAGGLSFGNDMWVFTTGARGMEIWQNAQLKSTNGANPTRTAAGDTSPLVLGNTAAYGRAGDLVKYHWVFIYDRQLGFGEVGEMFENPFKWVDTTW